MIDYASEDQVEAVGQTCKYFSSGGPKSRAFASAGENISCRACKNWNGNQCVRNAFDTILTNLGQD